MRFLFLSAMRGRDFREWRILFPEWILRDSKGFAKAAIIRNVREVPATYRPDLVDLIALQIDRADRRR